MSFDEDQQTLQQARLRSRSLGRCPIIKGQLHLHSLQLSYLRIKLTTMIGLPHLHLFVLLATSLSVANGQDLDTVLTALTDAVGNVTALDTCK